jgi:hypothetical protein
MSFGGRIPRFERGWHLYVAWLLIRLVRNPLINFIIDRIAGASSEINALKDAFNRGK